MTQAFFHAGQHRPVIAGLDVDHPVRSKSRLREPGREKVGPGDAPENLTLGACGDAGGEQR